MKKNISSATFEARPYFKIMDQNETLPMYMLLEREDWETLSTLASEIAAIIIADMESGIDPERQPTFEEDSLYAKVREHIEFMEMKYGPHPIILDTKADFVKNADEQIRLKEEAKLLCFPEDFLLRGNISKELAELYFDEKEDIGKATKLIDEAIQDLESGNDQNDLADAKQLKDRISNGVQ